MFSTLLIILPVEIVANNKSMYNIQDGFEPLHVAAQFGRTESIAALITAGANVNAANKVCLL